MAKNFEEKTEIDGIPAVEYMGKLLAEWEEDEVTLIKARTTICMMRQVNNAHRNLLRALINQV